MPTARVTKRAVDTAAPGFMWDDEVKGFGLRVTDKGSKSYVFQYRLGGREATARRITIGKHGTFTPELARTEAKRLGQMVARGTDPIDADRERRRVAVDLAFDAYVGIFSQGYLKSRWSRWEAAQKLLERHAVPILRGKPLPDIKRTDLARVFDPLAGKPATARLLHATMRKLFRWAVGRGDLDRSPMEGAEAPPSVPARERVLSDDELNLAWNGAAALDQVFVGFYRLLILTGQRREEVAGLKWEELSRTDAVWLLPSERAKNDKAHLVPLSETAVEVIDGHAGGKTWPKTGLVFTTNGRTSISGFSRAKAALDKAMQTVAGEGTSIPDWRVHDLRRTVATGLQRLGVRFEVTEAVLNHISGSRSGIAGVYQRHDWAVEKREALAAWGEHVRGLLT